MVSWFAGLSRMLEFRLAPKRAARNPAQRGSVAIQMGLITTVLIGMAGLGTEVPYIMYKQRQMQNAADSAALGAAVALSQGYPAITTEAYAIAAALGFPNGSNGVTVTVNNRPKAGNYIDNDSAVEVIVAQPQTLTLAGLFGVTAYNVNARSVALAGSSGAGHCILVTDPVGKSGWGGYVGLGMWGGVTITMNGCGIAVNSASFGSLTLASGGTLNAPLVSLSGTINNVWSTVNVTSLKQNQKPVSDPYANVAMPSSAGCDYNGFWASPNQLTVSPGRYCFGMSFAGGYTWTLQPGIYYIKSGHLDIAGGASLIGNGVTFVLTTTDGGSSYATLCITNGASLILSAPTAGSMSGILFFGDRNAPSYNTHFISGVTSANFQGAIYIPSQTIQYGGWGGFAGCQQLIAWHIDDYIVNLPFDGTCVGTGMKTIGASPTLLVE
jgi:Flp pilus assembly protein TadG